MVRVRTVDEILKEIDPSWKPRIPLTPEQNARFLLRDCRSFQRPKEEYVRKLCNMLEEKDYIERKRWKYFLTSKAISSIKKVCDDDIKSRQLDSKALDEVIASRCPIAMCYILDHLKEVKKDSVEEKRRLKSAVAN